MVDTTTFYLALAAAVEAIALVLTLAFGEDSFHRFFVKPRLKVSGWTSKIVSVKSHARTDNFLKILEPSVSLYKACLVFVEVSNGGFFNSIGLNPKMTVSLDEGEYALTAISPEFGNEARLHDWGMSNSNMPLESQTADHYIHQHFGVVPVSEMRKQMKFIAFKTVEGNGTVRLGVDNQIITKSIGENFDITVWVDAKSESGIPVSSKPTTFHVIFQRWDAPHIIMEKN